MLGRSIALSLIYLFSLINIEISNAALNCPLDTNNHSPTIVRTYVDIKDTNCTGTIVGNGRYVLTAAHCLVSSPIRKNPYTFISPKNISIMSGPNSEIQNGRAKSIIVHPLYTSDTADYHDIAFIELETPFESGESSTISFEKINIGQVAIVGGYGETKYMSYSSPDGHRRIGQNRIESIDDKYICLSRARIEANGIDILNSKNCIPAGMDSGSPLRINENIHAIHNHSYVSWLNDGSAIIKNCALNLRNPELKSFIQSVLGSKTKKAYKKQSQI